MLRLLKSRKDSDVTFLVGPNKIPIEGHQLVLKARSPVFEAMFSQNWEGGKEGISIAIPDAEPEPFTKFLEVKTRNFVVSILWRLLKNCIFFVLLVHLRGHIMGGERVDSIADARSGSQIHGRLFGYQVRFSSQEDHWFMYIHGPNPKCNRDFPGGTTSWP